jgi:crotonobetainyl-CoA:carnitine CoA-transferase CaiB-like acyl-CoA transferase
MRGPVLAGVRVLDISTRVAGPYCACLLAEFGADVIKIELPGEGDPYREVGTAAGGATLSYLNENRNKRCMTLDVRRPEGAELFLRLATNADFVVENFRPGTLEKWGLGYQALQAVNPGLVLVRISAYGQDGPYANRGGVARVAYGYSGVSYLCGEPNGPPLYPATIAFGDYVAGQCAATGALLAYIERQRSGQGQVIDVSLYESLLRMMDELVPAYAMTGEIRERTGAASGVTVPSNHYRSRDGKWVVLSCSSAEMFRRLAGAMGHPELVSQFPSRDSRMAHRQDIDAIVETWIGSLTRDEALAAADAAQIPAGPINNIEDLFADPHVRARGSLREVLGPDGSPVTVVDTVPRLSKTPGHIHSLGAGLGEHTHEVLTGLGLPADEIHRLREAGVI